MDKIFGKYLLREGMIRKGRRKELTRTRRN